MNAKSTGSHGVKRGAILKVHVTARASNNGIVKILDDGTIKIHLTAPPVEGRANEALKKFLAKILDIPVYRIEILTGESGRYKTILVEDMEASKLREKILEHRR